MNELLESRLLNGGDSFIRVTQKSIIAAET